MENIIYQAAALLISIGAFLLGKYVFPNVPKTVTTKLRELAAWADKFVVWAREFRKQDSGPDKMEMVVQQLQDVAEEAGWNVTEGQLRAIAQTAYENMMAGAAEAQQPQEAAKEPQKARYYKIGGREFAEGATVVINSPGVTVAGTPGVAVATENVPEGALDVNPDGSVNAYDEAGLKARTVAGVDVLVAENGAAAVEYARAAQEAAQAAQEAVGGTDTARAAEAARNGQETPQDGAATE